MADPPNSIGRRAGADFIHENFFRPRKNAWRGRRSGAAAGGQAKRLAAGASGDGVTDAGAALARAPRTGRPRRTAHSGEAFFAPQLCGLFYTSF